MTGNPMIYPVLMLAGIGVGILVGWFVLRAGWSWSWSSFAVPLPVVVYLFSWLVAIYTVVFVFVAVYRGAKRQSTEKEAGGELAQRARQRTTPVGAIKQRRARKPLLQRNFVEPNAIIIGENTRGYPTRVPLGDAESGKHTLVAGATGSGKTVTQALIARLHIQAGFGVIFYDPKGDRYLRGNLKQAAAERGRRFVEWSPDGSTLFNPFVHGGPTEIADKVLAAEIYTEPHYLRQAQRYLGHQLRVMRTTKQWPPTIQTIAQYLYPPDLETLAKRLPAGEQKDVRTYLKSLSAKQLADLGGTRDRLATLAESEIGRLLDTDHANWKGETLDLLEAIRKKDVVYIRLDSDRYPLAAEMLGAAVVCDLIAISATLQRTSPLPTLVGIDEFAAINTDRISSLFARGRSAGISLLLGVQTLADLDAARPDSAQSLIDQVLANITTAVIHHQPAPRAAEQLAAFAGTQEVWGATQQTQALIGSYTTQKGSRKREREYHAHPDQIKTLKKGEAVVVCNEQAPRVQITKILHPNHPKPLKGKTTNELAQSNRR